MANEDGDVKGVDLEDSNMANYGSDEHVAARKAAAQSDPQFKKAGEKVGLEVWRVENRRTKSDTPDFGIKRWPKEDYGQFYSGDSYLVLNTYKDKESDKFLWDIHFWLGKETSIDEQGVAAYKAVELDDLLDGEPMQHREVQEHESQLFQSYFEHLEYLEGGIASGFREVKPEEYKPRLLQVRRTKKTVRAFEVPVKVDSLHHGDVFVLDNGRAVYTWVGDQANAFEKMKGGTLSHNICSSRQGKAKRKEVDEDFWSTLGGTEDQVGPPVEHEEEQTEVDKDKMKLFRISDASGKVTFTKEAEGKVNTGMLDTNDVFIVDAQIEVFIWIGKNATKKERSVAMTHAVKYLESEGRPTYLPITRIQEGQVHHLFKGCFEY